MTDESRIDFGRYAGFRLIDVPADYLIWLYENDKCPGPLRKYIRENMDVLKLQSKNK